MRAGQPVEVDVVRQPGSATSPAVVEKQSIHLLLHAIHMDYIMRNHVTTWFGPSADHPGGWCRCVKGDDPDPTDGVVTSRKEKAASAESSDNDNQKKKPPVRLKRC